MSETSDKSYLAHFASEETKCASSNEVQKGISAKIVPGKAEGEVVAIILSAIMGSIVGRCELLHHEDRESETCSPCESVIEEPDEDINEKNITKVKSGTYKPTAYKNQNKLFSGTRTIVNSSDNNGLRPSVDNVEHSEEKLVSNESQVKSISSEVSAPKQPSITEEEMHLPYTILLKELIAELKEKIFGWQFLEAESEVVIVFKQGNRYEGRLLNCRMHGQGKFVWSDGSVYEGSFSNGEMTGQGWLQWPDQSWYEGQLAQGYRHGLGLYVQDSFFYTGRWRCGLRHGLGAMFYNRSNTDINYYNGEWSSDCKHGTGLRNYPSGAMYSGEWSAGARHGLGTMVWTNNDVFSGNWDKGLIHGYGEYTWETFSNHQLVVPQENCYYGNWEHGIRHGNGTLETNLGVRVRGTWSNGKKHGAAEVICSNGYFVYSDFLFIEDCISMGREGCKDANALADMSIPSFHLYKVPVNAANHDIDVRLYSNRLDSYILECRKNGKVFGQTVLPSAPNTNKNTQYRVCNVSNHFSSVEDKLDKESEELMLRNILLQYLSALKVIYMKYCELCCEVKPNFASVLMRVMLWQLLRDCNLHTRGASLADFDILIANNKLSLVQSIHYPFERLQFWQFLHCIIELSWELYGKHYSGTPVIQGVLASALHRLITADILPNAGRHKGNALFKYKNILNLDSTYWYYRGIGEPHSARKFFKTALVPCDEPRYRQSVPEYPDHLLHGTNVIGVGGRLTYFPKNEPLIPTKRSVTDNNHSQDLASCLRGVGPLAVFNCILEVCPGIAVGGLIVNMDYKIVFLEFLELIFLCARLKVQKINLEKKANEIKTTENTSQDKLKDNVEDTSAEPVEEKRLSLENDKSKKSIKPKKKKDKNS